MKELGSSSRGVLQYAPTITENLYLKLTTKQKRRIFSKNVE